MRTSLRSIYRLTREPGEVREPFPLGHKLTAWRNGFLSFSEALYGFPENDRRDYVSDYTRMYRCNRLNPAPEFFDHKFLLRSVLLQKGFPQPETVALVSGEDVLLDPFAEGTSYLRTGDLAPWLVERGGSFILKPQNGRFGRDIYLLEVGRREVLLV